MNIKMEFELTNGVKKIVSKMSMNYSIDKLSTSPHPAQRLNNTIITKQIQSIYFDVTGHVKAIWIRIFKHLESLL